MTKLTRKSYVPQRGDIVMIKMKGEEGSVQKGVRPYIVLTNNLGNLHGPTIIAAPLSTKIKSMHLPIHVIVKDEDLEEGRLINTSIVLLEQLIVIDKKSIIRKVGKVKRDTLINQINPAIKISLDVY